MKSNGMSYLVTAKSFQALEGSQMNQKRKYDVKELKQLVHHNAGNGLKQ